MHNWESIPYESRKHRDEPQAEYISVRTKPFNNGRKSVPKYTSVLSAVSTHRIQQQLQLFTVIVLPLSIQFKFIIKIIIIMIHSIIKYSLFY